MKQWVPGSQTTMFVEDVDTKLSKGLIWYWSWDENSEENNEVCGVGCYCVW
jgi:hypothetical protein